MYVLLPTKNMINFFNITMVDNEITNMDVNTDDIVGTFLHPLSYLKDFI